MNRLIINIKKKGIFIAMILAFISLQCIQGQSYDEANDMSISQSSLLPGHENLFDTKLSLIDSLLDIPNVFSPSIADYSNFAIRSTTTDPISIQIFTRSGDLVFKAKAPEIYWDGRSSSGQILPSGVYYYIIEYKVQPTTLTKTGFVYLFRD